MKPLLSLILPLALMACVDPGLYPPVPIDQIPVDHCNATVFQGLVGQSGQVLNGMRFATDVRVIQPDMVVTMEFSPNRLNIWLGRGNVIERVTCG